MTNSERRMFRRELRMLINYRDGMIASALNADSLEFRIYARERDFFLRKWQHTTAGGYAHLLPKPPEPQPVSQAGSTTLVVTGPNRARKKKRSNCGVTNKAKKYVASLSLHTKQAGTKGTRSKNCKPITSKQQMDQVVSTLRRLYYHKKLTQEEADAEILFKINNSENNYSWYTMSSHRPGHIYAEVEGNIYIPEI